MLTGREWNVEPLSDVSRETLDGVFLTRRMYGNRMFHVKHPAHPEPVQVDDEFRQEAPEDVRNSELPRICPGQQARIDRASPLANDLLYPRAVR